MADDYIYDVAIVGGGLAGLCMAIQCAGAGHSTILFEKEAYPFHKVCGEYISMESYPFLQQLGLDLAALHLPVIKQLKVTDVNGKAYHFALPLGGFGISRYTLDDALYKLALHKGVSIMHAKVEEVHFINDRFQLKGNNGIWLAKVAAGCFGKRSNLDVKWKRAFAYKSAPANNYVGIKYHVVYPHPADEIALHNFRDGYCGISQIEAGQSCLCYLATAKQLQQAGSIKKLEAQVLGQNVQLRKIFEEATFLYDEPLAISQVSFAAKETIYQHMLMVGDAAGLITPLCGNGMSMAMHGSKIAFDTVNDYLQGNITRLQMETLYTQMWRKQFSTRLATGRMVQQFFGHPAVTGLFLKTVHAIPFLSKKLISSTHGSPF